MVKVVVKDLTKKYGEVQALKNLDLNIDDKEFFILLGPSGCGKSTALLCIAGLLRPDKGEIWFDNKLVTNPQRDVSVPPQERQVAMVFQDYALYPHMTVFKNIAFPLEVRGVNPAKIPGMVKATTDLLGISQLLNRKPKQLSGGQRQRVALGRAIVRQPKIFLMDEPLANLDAKLRVYMRVELKKLHQKLGTTTIYVTHDQVEAMSLGDRVAVLKDGILQQVAAPTELYDAPKNTFVAGFIGSPPMNMLNGKLVRKGGKLEIDLGVATFELPYWAQEKLKQMQTSEVVLGFRPEDIGVVGKYQENAIEAKVEMFESIGREIHSHLTAGDYPIVVVTTSAEDVKVGQSIWVVLNEEKIHVFDGKTGELLA
ncbi:MAG: ABC transporter ATP-binding protein [Candidatus Bathyarchaeia archaeon]